MPPTTLYRIAFSSALLGDVQDFTCGDEEWERDVADWISNPERALKDIDLGCKVWVWADDERNLVGCGSLGVTHWRIPNPNKSALQPISVIPYIAVHSRFQGEPRGLPSEERYARLILEDVIAEAAEAADTRPFLGLFVHVDNERARRFYRRAGFDDFGKPFVEKQTGWPHQKMLYDLRTRSIS